jgi:hypothetical protein
MFECSVTGVGSTIWRGSAFNCPLREIVLLHNQFIDSKGTCNDGAIVARGVSVESDRYTSRLNITLSANLNGETILCAHHNSIGTTIVGTFLVNFTSGKLYDLMLFMAGLYTYTDTVTPNNYKHNNIPMIL